MCHSTVLSTCEHRNSSVVHNFGMKSSIFVDCHKYFMIDMTTRVRGFNISGNMKKGNTLVGTSVILGVDIVTQTHNF